jgi:hypothetical protein
MHLHFYSFLSNYFRYYCCYCVPIVLFRQYSRLNQGTVHSIKCQYPYNWNVNKHSFYIILTSTIMSLIWFIPLRFLDKNFAWIFHFHICDMCSAYFIFHHPKNIKWSVITVKHLIMLSLALRYSTHLTAFVWSHIYMGCFLQQQLQLKVRNQNLSMFFTLNHQYTKWNITAGMCSFVHSPISQISWRISMQFCVANLH